jgi:hypothetical protein
MRNTITEGKDRELPPDAHGEIVRVPTPATVELAAEILHASAFKEAGQDASMRERSSIESRTELRRSATNEMLQSNPARLDAMLAIDPDTARRWADLDAGDFGRIRSDSRREAALDAIAGHMRACPEYADALGARSPAMAESALALNDERDRAERLMALPMIECNASALTSAPDSPELPAADPCELARQDTRSVAILPLGSTDRHLAAAVVGENARNHTAYRDELQRVAPQLAREVLVAVVERDALRAIERRNDALMPVARDALSVSQARAAVKEDLANIAIVQDANVRTEAAVAMGDNARNQANYRAELELRAPDVAMEVKAAGAENERRMAEKEDRKAAEVLAMQRALGERAAAWTPEQAAEHARADLASLRAGDASERHFAMGDMVTRAERNAAYADTLTQEGPDVAREVEERRGREASERAAAERHQEIVSADTKTRAALIDAAALANLAKIRARETARVVEKLAGSPDTATQQLRDAMDSLKAPPLDGRVTAPDDPDIAAQQARAIRRPVVEAELSQALQTRFVVSHGKRGLLDKGATEFTFREGEQRGKVAFVDMGKSLSTTLEDKATIRAMVEVATAKHWKEITVSGTDGFRRDAWLEASLHGIQVRGYEPREADKRLLAELRQHDQPANVITAAEREHKKEQPREALAESAQPRTHIDGDALTAHEKTVLDHSRAILDAKALGPQFTQAALKDLEARLRGERVYVGQVIAHGLAPYQFDKNNDDSYYVTLKTRSGEQVVWGKGLAEAMEERRAGEQIVLQNIGKRDVTVQERLRNAQGQVVGTRLKESQLNAWRSELLSRYSEKARTEFANGSAARQPSFAVYDPKAPRPTGKSAALDERSPDKRRSAETQRNARER